MEKYFEILTKRTKHFFYFWKETKTEKEGQDTFAYLCLQTHSRRHDSCKRNYCILQ